MNHLQRFAGFVYQDAVAGGDLTGTVGGAVNWTPMYDAGVNRFAFHDLLTDVPTLAPNGVVDDLATYLVGGWSDPKLDPLDVADTAHSLSARLAELSWPLVTDAEGGDQVNPTFAVEPSFARNSGGRQR